MSRVNTYRLADSTVGEPLINNWGIWSDLISPAPYSMHMLHYQIQILTSYLTNPDMHVKASQNPKFISGAFVNVPVRRAYEIQELLETTVREQSKNIELAKAITEGYEFLNKEAKGQSLEPYYDKLPAALHGYVELLYDYYNHPILRLLEGLLYESPYYNVEFQSLRIFGLKRDDSRPFFLNTPRLLNEDEIAWKVPLDSPRLDEFFRLETKPHPLEEICNLLELEQNHSEKLMPLLSQEPIPSPERWTGIKPRIRYLGHACVLIEWNGIAVMTDPWVGAIPSEGGIERISYRDLPDKIDYALITHGHHDHFVPETLLRLRHKIECLVVPRSFGLFYADASLRLMAQKLGFKQVRELDALESIKLPDGEILAVPFLGEHADLAHGKVGYVVRAGKETLLFAADSNCVDTRLYEHLHKSIGDMQTVFLGMECVGAPLSWLYGALLPTRLPHSQDKSRRTKGSDSAAALALLEAVGAKRVYIYAMGNEPWFHYSMGLGLGADSKQIKESNNVLSSAREKGFLDAQRPFGKFEISL